MTFKMWLIVAGALGALSVLAGAFGAHGLEGSLTPDLLVIFETGARYHMYHALALLALALAGPGQLGDRWLHATALCWTLGVVVFSGSLYLLALSGVRALGAITPVGGVLLVAGWTVLAVAAWRRMA